MATIRRHPPSAAGSAKTASSKSLASAPSIVTRGVSRKSTRSPRSGTAAAAALSNISAENSCGSSNSATASWTKASGLCIWPISSMIFAVGSARPLRGMRAAFTNISGVSTLSSSALTGRERLAPFSVLSIIQRPPLRNSRPNRWS